MEAREETSFGKIRSLLWPIHTKELKKFVPMFLMFFLIAFVYNLLRASKDAMIVTAKASGAEAIPFLKVWFMFPMACLMTWVYTRISNRFSREKAFYIMVSIFLVFFFVFTFILYPNRESLHPHEFADKIQSYLPLGLRGFVALFRNWVYSAFYVMSELWSAIIFSMLFWGFANQVTNVKEAKRFYGLFSLGANASGIFAGQATVYLSSAAFRPYIPYGSTAWEQSVLFINSTILLSGLLILFLFRTLHKNNPYEKVSFTEKTKKIKMSLRDNFRYLSNSKYLLCIAMIVLMYNLSINLVEVVWKNQVKALYPNPSDFTHFMGQVMFYMGCLATFTSLFLTGFCLRRFSWTINALIPPIVMLATGAAFFFVTLFQNYGNGYLPWIVGASPLFLSVILGTIQNCLARASKYTLFDATKELAFVPLSKECKLKGKSAIDGVGSRLGKSGGSLIHQGLLMTFITVSAATPVASLIFFGVVSVWIGSVFSLGKRFSSLTSQEESFSYVRDEKPTVQTQKPVEKPI